MMAFKKFTYGLVGLVLLGAIPASSAATVKGPQMGWNSWNYYKANIDQSVIEQTADLLVSSGLRDAGYSYIILDEGWQAKTRDASGLQQFNSTKFPAGGTALANYVHSKGLKLGIYSDAGLYDCDFYPGSYGNEELDAATYASWGVDYLKYDNCGGFMADTEAPQVRFSAMMYALKNSGRDIFYSLCQWGNQFPWYWADQIGQSYRISGDITTVFTDTGSDCACTTAYCLNTGYAGCSVLTLIRKMREISPFQKAGSFADMDMLEIGIANMTLNEQRTHFSFWAALKSPLILGAPIAQLPNSTLTVIKNRDMIAISQDSLATAANYIEALSSDRKYQVWAGPLSQGKTVILALNEQNVTASVNVEFSKVPNLNSSSFSVREVWSAQELGRVKTTINATLEQHETKVYILSSWI